MQMKRLLSISIICMLYVIFHVVGAAADAPAGVPIVANVVVTTDFVDLLSYTKEAFVVVVSSGAAVDVALSYRFVLYVCLL